MSACRCACPAAHADAPSAPLWLSPSTAGGNRSENVDSSPASTSHSDTQQLYLWLSVGTLPAGTGGMHRTASDEHNQHHADQGLLCLM